MTNTKPKCPICGSEHTRKPEDRHTQNEIIAFTLGKQQGKLEGIKQQANDCVSCASRNNQQGKLELVDEQILRLKTQIRECGCEERYDELCNDCEQAQEDIFVLERLKSQLEKEEVRR